MHALLYSKNEIKLRDSALCCPFDIAVTTVEHFVIFAGGGGGT
jgi:hypothetical protein